MIFVFSLRRIDIDYATVPCDDTVLFLIILHVMSLFPVTYSFEYLILFFFTF